MKIAFNNLFENSLNNLKVHLFSHVLLSSTESTRAVSNTQCQNARSYEFA